MNIFLLIPIFGYELTIGEIILILSIIGSIIVFLIWYKPEKLKRFSEAKLQSLKLGQAPSDREAWFQEQFKKWINDLGEIRDDHNKELKERDDQIAKLLKERLDILAQHDEIAENSAGERVARRRLMFKLDYAYWETDKSGKLEYANGAWLEMFGLRIEEAKGEGWLSSIADGDKKRVAVEWYSRLADLRDDEPIDFQAVNSATGKEMNLSAVFTISKDSDGNACKCFGVTVRAENELKSN